MDKTVYKQFARNVGISASADVALRMKGFILMPILTKSFGTVNYGIWAQISVIVGLLAAFVTLGIDNSVTRFLPGKSKTEIREGFYSFILFQLATSVIICLVLVFSAAYLAGSFFDGTDNARFVILAGVFLISTSCANSFRRYFRIFTQMKMYNSLIIFTALANAGAGAVVAIFHYTIFELVIASIVIDGITVLISLFIIISQIGISFPRFTSIKTYLAFGLPLIPAGLANWVINRSNQLFIAHYAGLAALGVYSVVTGLAEMAAFLFFDPIFLMITPVISKLWNEKKQEDIGRIFQYSLKYGLMFAIPALVGFSIIGRSFLTSFTTREFAAGFYLIPLITGSYILFMVSGMAGQVFWLVQKTRISAFTLGGACILNVILNWILVPRLGLLGAGITILATFISEMIATIIISRRFYRIDYNIRFILKSIVASSIMGLVIWWYSPTGIVHILLAVILGIVIYFTCLLVMRGFSRAEAEFFIDLVPSVKVRRWLLGLPGIKRKAVY